MDYLEVGSENPPLGNPVAITWGEVVLDMRGIEGELDSKETFLIVLNKRLTYSLNLFILASDNMGSTNSRFRNCFNKKYP